MKKREVIFDCHIGSETFGVVTVTTPLIRHIVYIDTLPNIVGFRRYLPFYVNANAFGFEIGHFVNMLYESSFDAYTMLNCPKDFINLGDPDFEVLANHKDEFVSKSLVRRLVKEAESSYKVLKKKDSLKIEKNVIEKLAYDTKIAYICVLKLRIARDILEQNKYIVDRPDFELLTAIYEGRVSLKAIQKEIRALRKTIKKGLSQSTLIDKPSSTKLNLLLWEIRNVNDKTRVYV